MAAKQVYWSIQSTGTTATVAPPGLGCVFTSNSTVVVYVSDPDDPDAEVLVSTSHERIVGRGVKLGRYVGALLVKLLNATFEGGNTWQLHLEYESEAVTGGDLDPCHIAQAQCYDHSTQAHLDLFPSEVDPTWLASLNAHLDEDLAFGDLPDLTPA